MFKTFFQFELRSWLRSPMPWIFLFIIALLSFFGTISDEVTIGGSFGNVWKNAPFVAQNWYGVFSLLCILLTTAFLNTAAIRDFERQTSQIIFSKPIGKGGYYFGHFTAALLVSLIPMLGVSLGMWTGAGFNGIFEWLEPNRFGPFEIKGHLLGVLIFALPNTLFVGGVLYAVAVNTRSTLYSFVAATALLVGYIVAGNLLRDLDNEQLAMLLDPFGFRAFSIETKYWTVEEKNHLALGFSGGLLLNRLLWSAIGLAVLYIGYRLFDFSEKKSGGKKAAKAEKSEDGQALKSLGALPRVAVASGAGTTFSQLWSQFKTEWLGIVRSTAFILLAILGLLNCVPNLFSANDGYGTHELPVTYTMVNLIRGSFYMFSIIIMVYFSGMVIWKERSNRISEITDALPTKNWTAWAGKYLAVLGVMFVLQALVMLSAIIAQKALGFNDLNMWVYVREMFVIDMFGFAFMLALAFLVQALSSNMYLGFFITIMFIIVNSFVWSTVKIESNMVEFAATPSYILSDFYGYQPFGKGLFWFHAYWGLFCALLTLAAIVFWPRGKESGWKKRFKIARMEWPQYRVFGYGAIALFLLTGGWTYYNTQMLNKYVNSGKQERYQFDYEIKYKK
ncbi:MAG TPA: hypothetical protein PKH43_12745, partial [Saprospiraceae bacterium]|nr:hypothetical protein [Saprospiraceae bacterium]